MEICHGFLRDIAGTSDDSRFFGPNRRGRAAGTCVGRGLLRAVQRPSAPNRVRRGARARGDRTAHRARRREHARRAGDLPAGCRADDGRRRARDVRRCPAKATMDACAERLPGAPLLPTGRLPVVLPAGPEGLNYFASAWAAIENVLLAAANEGLACAFRIPICDEAEHVKQAVGAPKGYELACFLAIGHPAPDARRCRQKAIDVPSRIHHGSW